MMRIPTKPLLVSSAVFMGLVGLAGTFAAEEALASLGTSPDQTAVMLGQILGAIYLGFAMLNWMSRNAPMGGIYSRPLTTANFLHFMMVALASWKFDPIGESGNVNLVLSVIYTIFALAFGMVLFTSPGTESAPS